jgi:chemotaxis protein methyltransferase CheR
MHEHVVEPLPPVTFNVGVPSVPPDAWIETIRAAAERIDELMHATPARDDEAPDLAGARASIERERFGDALHQLSEVSPQDTENADVLLLRAVSLVHGGDLDAGEASCRRLLDIDRFSAGGHYLLALCHEGRNDLAGARYHDEVALHLEPSFAMARLHLGLLERRSGRLESARTQLDDALVALEREDPSRLLLFGGGFAREGLLSLCRGALAACAA